jgi:hypothetical protein
MTMRPDKLAAVVLVALCTACVSTPPACPELGTKPLLVAELFFGRNIGPSLGVSDADWDQFTSDTLTPRFPDGFTSLDAHGQWLDATAQKPEREPSKLVVIATADTPGTYADLAFVTAEYKRRFQQQSVGVLLDHRCGAF